jgi:hypothetical protein
VVSVKRSSLTTTKGVPKESNSAAKIIGLLEDFAGEHSVFLAYTSAKSREDRNPIIYIAKDYMELLRKTMTYKISRDKSMLQVTCIGVFWRQILGGGYDSTSTVFARDAKYAMSHYFLSQPPQLP